MEPFRGVSMKCLDAYLAWFKQCRTFMVIDSRTAEPSVARQLANGTCSTTSATCSTSYRTIWSTGSRGRYSPLKWWHRGIQER